MNKLWKKYDLLVEKCYENMIGANKDGSCWQQAFEVLKEVVLEEREKNRNFAAELELLDDATDYAHDVNGWLEDYLDELDMKGDHDNLLKACDWLLTHFSWVDDSAAPLYFDKAHALNELGRAKEAYQFCRKWFDKDQENPYAGAALIYACLREKDFAGAEEIVSHFLNETTECGEENELVFTAAEALYQATGDKKKLERIQAAEKVYEEYLENSIMDMDEDWSEEDEEWFGDDDLPFN